MVEISRETLENMTLSEAFYIIGNLPIPFEDENYDICQYQQAKAIALDCMAKLEKIEKGQKDFEELELKMHKYFQTINLSDKHTELEKLALDIVCDGMQTLGCLNGILRGENE